MPFSPSMHGILEKGVTNVINPVVTYRQDHIFMGQNQFSAKEIILTYNE